MVNHSPAYLLNTEENNYMKYDTTKPDKIKWREKVFVSEESATKVVTHAQSNVLPSPHTALNHPYACVPCKLVSLLLV